MDESNDKNIKVERIMVPQFSATSIEVVSNGVDFLLTFAQMVPVSGGEGVGKSPVCSIAMSKGTTKELAVMLASTVAQLESEFGAIDTPYLRQRQKAEQ